MSVIKCGKLSPFNLVVQRFLAGIRRVCVSSVYCKWMSEKSVSLGCGHLDFVFISVESQSQLMYLTKSMYLTDRVDCVAAVSYSIQFLYSISNRFLGAFTEYYSSPKVERVVSHKICNALKINLLKYNRMMSYEVFYKI